MWLFIRTTALLLTAWSAGCGNLQAVKLAEVPTQLSGSSFRLSPDRPGKDSVAPRAYEVPARSIFLQQTSGGSLAVGLLLGPLGVLANVANIDRITREVGASGQGSSLYSVDALGVASSAWMSLIDSAGETAALSVKPFLLLLADEKTGITTIASFRVESSVRTGDERSMPWAAQYGYVLRDTLPFGALQVGVSDDALGSYRAELLVAFQELRSELESDLKRGPAPKRQIAWVKSPALGNIGYPGDIEQRANGRLSLRITTANGGLLSAPLFVYGVTVFPSADQYSFDNGPVDRR